MCVSVVCVCVLICGHISLSPPYFLELGALTLASRKLQQFCLHTTSSMVSIGLRVSVQGHAQPFHLGAGIQNQFLMMAA